jgi:5-keto 4-deoxyuronate isomerase
MQLTIDVSTWTQEEKNMLQAAAVSLLYAYDNRFEGNGIYAKNGIITIDDSLNPPAEVKDVLSASNLKIFLVAELEKIRIANEAAQKEAQTRDAELVTNQFTDIKLAKVDTAIDAITNLAELKVLLKKFVRFVIART